MAPSERLGIKSAVISVLAGDLFGGTRFKRGLYLFRALYYIFSIAHLRRTFVAWRRRAFNIRDDSEMRLTRG
jgi:hypothetical protein